MKRLFIFVILGFCLLCVTFSLVGQEKDKKQSGKDASSDIKKKDSTSSTSKNEEKTDTEKFGPSFNLLNINKEKKKEKRYFTDSSEIIPVNKIDDYKEDALKRFSLIFFITIPYAWWIDLIFFQSLICRNVKSNSFQPGEITEQMEFYMLISSIMVGFSVALYDYRCIYGDLKGQEGALIVYLGHSEDNMTISFNFLQFTHRF